MLTDKQSRVSIAHLPTSLEPLPRLTVQLGGPELWIKRDDQTGLATGGNKARKLEFLVADALAQGADTLITAGAAQSNHARQTAAAAAKFGLTCMPVLRGTQPPQVQGNLLLDRLLGAEVVWAREQPLAGVMAQVAEKVRAAGHRPYAIPYGGSNPSGACGYVAAMEELLAQGVERNLHFDHVVLASSSGGTQAGLAVGARALGYEGRILGISVDEPAGALRQKLAGLATATAELLGLKLTFAPEDFAVDDGYLGGGYGVVGDLERRRSARWRAWRGSCSIPSIPGGRLGGCWTWSAGAHSSPRSVCCSGTLAGRRGCLRMGTSCSDSRATALALGINL